ncbi:uncharacterized protein LOC117618659 [Prunus dulcis]|nr:uncharacterized protein LOC117618659 [Prunus dulcis]
MLLFSWKFYKYHLSYIVLNPNSFITCQIPPPAKSKQACLKQIFITMMTIMESSIADVLVKVAMFILIQGLVYLILSNSSNIFSKTTRRSHSFKPARSVSIRRMLAALADLPAGGELSPSSNYSWDNLQSPRSQENATPRYS